MHQSPNSCAGRQASHRMSSILIGLRKHECRLLLLTDKSEEEEEDMKQAEAPVQMFLPS